jgi:hypothetical protein
MAACKSCVSDRDSLGYSTLSPQKAFSEYVIYTRNRKEQFPLCAQEDHLLFIYPSSVLLSDEGTANIRPSSTGQVITAMTMQVSLPSWI